MQYQIASVNWPRQLAEAIASAQDGDTIIVASEAAKDLAERAKLRMCPDKQITFEVWSACTIGEF